jgi:ribosomal protein L9
LARQRAELEARATGLQGREITIPARANPEGHLYGSVGPAQIVASLAEDGIFIDAENVVLEEPIRQLDKYDVTVRFAPEVTATIHVWVVPVREAEGEDDLPEAPADEGAATSDAAPEGEVAAADEEV